MSAGLIAPLQRWWAVRPPKERWLLAAAASVLVAGLAELAWLAPIHKDLERERRTLQLRADELASAKERERTRIASARGAVASTADAELLARVREAENRIEQLREHSADATRLPQMLRALAQTMGPTSLLALDLSPGTPLPQVAQRPAATPADGAVGSGAALVTGPVSGSLVALHQLPVSLKVSGSWSELQSLLTQVERHAPALRWSKLTLDSAQWPAIELTLLGHAISTQPQWGRTP